jgi:hypothetical protein
MMQVGTKVRTLYEHSETGTIVRPRKINLPLPSPHWFIIKFDRDGGKLCVHRDMMTIRNDA